MEIIITEKEKIKISELEPHLKVVAFLGIVAIIVTVIKMVLVCLI